MQKGVREKKPGKKVNIEMAGRTKNPVSFSASGIYNEKYEDDEKPSTEYLFE